MPATAELQRAAAAGLGALDVWEREASTDTLTGQPMTPEEQWAAVGGKLMDFALNHHRTHRNRPLDLSAPWLRAIYADTHRHIVIRKSVKCGISEYLVVRELAEAAVGRQVIHVLPDHTLRPRFVADRVDKPLAFAPLYRELAQIAVGVADNRTFKSFGDGMIFYLGSNTPTPFTEVVGDTAIVDEKDHCNLENLLLLGDRLAAEGTVSAWAEVGNPTHPDFGISADYDASDRGEWQVKCESCGAWQRVDWFAHVVAVERDDEGVIVEHRVRDAKWTGEGALRAVCARCGKAFDHLGRGRWAFQAPGATTRGYHVSKLMTRQATLAELYRTFAAALGDASKMARFINNDLGLAHSPPGSSVTRAMLDGCRHRFGNYHQAAGPCVMGVDIGSVLDIRVSDSPEPETRRSRYIGRAPLKVDEVVGRIKKFNVRACVLDAGPETFFCREVLKALTPAGARRHGVWLCQFAAGADVKEPRKDARERVVKVDRTQAFDAATARIRKRLNWLPRHAADLLDGDYYTMMQTPKRVLQETPTGERYVWTKGFDHARLADVYDELAYRLGGAQLSRAPKGGLCRRMTGAEKRARTRRG